MRQKILFIIDDIKKLNYKKDSSLLMMHSISEKNHDIYFCYVSNLSFSTSQGAVTIAQSIILYPDYSMRPDFYQSIGEKEILSLNDFSIIFMRKDPPVDEAYLTALKILNLADKSKVKLVNPPDKLHTLNEKLFAFEFPQIMPDTLFTNDKNIALDFAREYPKVIIKPIDGMGGKGVFISDSNDANFAVIFETLSHNFAHPILIQQFIPDIIHGDKRILIVNGHVFDHALARIPAAGQIRGNLAVGGTYQAVPLNKTDFHIAHTVAERLVAEDISICGIDVIGDKLTEINITSPTCFQELYKLTGRNPFDFFFE